MGDNLPALFGLLAFFVPLLIVLWLLKGRS